MFGGASVAPMNWLWTASPACNKARRELPHCPRSTSRPASVGSVAGRSSPQIGQFKPRAVVADGVELAALALLRPSAQDPARVRPARHLRKYRIPKRHRCTGSAARTDHQSGDEFPAAESKHRRSRPRLAARRQSRPIADRRQTSCPAARRKAICPRRSLASSCDSSNAGVRR